MQSKKLKHKKQRRLRHFLEMLTERLRLWGKCSHDITVVWMCHETL